MASTHVPLRIVVTDEDMVVKQLAPVPEGSTCPSPGPIKSAPSSQSGRLSKTSKRAGESSSIATKKANPSGEDLAVVGYASSNGEDGPTIEYSYDGSENGDAITVELLRRWNSDSQVSEMLDEEEKQGTGYASNKQQRSFMPAFEANTDDDENNSGSDVSVDGDQLIAADMLQTWENLSDFSNDQDNK